MQTYTLDELNESAVPEFVGALAQVYEHSPWVIQSAAAYRPFKSVKSMQAVCEAVLYGASVEGQTALIQAHPDLAAKLDELARLTEFSQAEQARAGFAALPADSIAELRKALAAYRQRYGHPFILCVTEHRAEEVLPLLKARSHGSAQAERMACLYQIARIGWHRLGGLLNYISK